MRWETDIRANVDRVFALLCDLREYDRWLPRSFAFRGTSSISEGPIGAGTTYVERSVLGTRNGTVSTLVRPTRIDFTQPMTLRPRALGIVGIRICNTLSDGPLGVHLERRLELTPSGPMKPMMRFAAPLFSAENERVLEALKSYAEIDGK